ncbi:MAG: rhodanese-like domain-containing protein, partial [Anaerolineae bacterium]|nr:rhodanese-like domain-containing protein [Anaerolineae bacterium]
LVVSITGCGVAHAAVVEEAVVAGDVEAAPEVVELSDEVKPETVAEFNAQGKIAVIDVREDWEFAEGHIPGATLIPLGSLPDRVDEIPTDKPVVLVCRSGNRSGQAFRFLSGEGYDNISNMTGGMNAWSAAGLDVEE